MEAIITGVIVGVILLIFGDSIKTLWGKVSKWMIPKLIKPVIGLIKGTGENGLINPRLLHSKKGNAMIMNYMILAEMNIKLLLNR